MGIVRTHFRTLSTPKKKKKKKRVSFFNASVLIDYGKELYFHMSGQSGNLFAEKRQFARHAVSHKFAYLFTASNRGLQVTKMLLLFFFFFFFFLLLLLLLLVLELGHDSKEERKEGIKKDKNVLMLPLRREGKQERC